MIFRPFVDAAFKSYSKFTINKLRNFVNFWYISNPITASSLESFVVVAVILFSFIIAPSARYSYLNNCIIDDTVGRRDYHHSLASSSRWFSFANNTKMPQTPANSRNEIYEALKELWFLDNTDNIFKSRYFFVCATTNKKNTTLNYIWKSCYKSGAKFTKLTVHTEMRSKLWLCQLRVSFISFFNIRWTTKIKITTQIVLTKHNCVTINVTHKEM